MATTHAQVSGWRNQLSPHIIDHLANVLPDAPYTLFPNSPTTYDDGYRTVTYKDLANAINGLAWWLHDTLGPSKNFETIGYVGLNDLRYPVFVLGAVKAGYVAFLTSPRNSTAAQGSLFEQTNCKTLCTSHPVPPPVSAMLQEFPSVKHLQVPSVDQLLNTQNSPYPFHKTFEGSRLDPYLIVHTSGSTGTPKPLVWTHETISRVCKQAALSPPPGFESIDSLWQGKKILNTFPPFHAAGISILIVNCVAFGTVSIAPLSGAIPTAEGVVNALKTAPADTALLAPSIAAELARHPSLLEYCSQNLDQILYAGGDLPQSFGDIISQKLPIRCLYGASETGFVPQLRDKQLSSPPEWGWMHFRSDLGLQFEEITPGLFELVLKRGPEFEDTQMPFTIGGLDRLEAYRTRDLFHKHPTLQNYWRWRARSDDIIVFLNGEKTNPLSMELSIASSKNITAALVVGMQRFQAALIVEPAEQVPPEKVTEFLKSIWPVIEEANKVAPSHARVDPDMVLVTSPGKPMIRSGKGTIQRQATIILYSTEVDDLYKKADAAVIENEKPSVNIHDRSEVRAFIRKVVNPHLSDGGESFFAQGMDSLGAIRLARALRHGLGRGDFNVSMIYNNPSVEELTDFIATGTSPQLTTDPETNALLKEYELQIKNIRSPRDQYGQVVLLTGSTGSLGSRLLEALLSRSDISHIYCVNRNPNASKVHDAKAKASGFALNEHLDRITFLHTRGFDQQDLGLGKSDYNTLSSTVSLIIHNAWAVNFLMPLKAFRSHLDGLLSLIRLASTRTDPPKLLYISSISAVANLPNLGTNTIPERVIRDLDAALGIGYAKSKQLSEILCDTAARDLKVPISFARVGQVGGPVKGDTTWNIQEWFPSLLITSVNLGFIPDDLGKELSQISWIPADILATTLVELTTSNRSKEQVNGAEVFNVLNPQVTSWKELLPNVIESVEKHTGKQLEIVPVVSWLDKLRAVSENITDSSSDILRTHPAIKLTEFYENNLLGEGKAARWDTDHAVTSSKSMQEIPAVGKDWLDLWVRGWSALVKKSI